MGPAIIWLFYLFGIGVIASSLDFSSPNNMLVSIIVVAGAVPYVVDLASWLFSRKMGNTGLVAVTAIVFGLVASLSLPGDVNNTDSRFMGVRYLLVGIAMLLAIPVTAPVMGLRKLKAYEKNLRFSLKVCRLNQEQVRKRALIVLPYYLAWPTGWVAFLALLFFKDRFRTLFASSLYMRRKNKSGKTGELPQVESAIDRMPSMHKQLVDPFDITELWYEEED